MIDLSSSDGKSVHAGRAKSYIEAERYRNSFIDQSTQAYRSELMETRSCPACESSSSSELLMKNGGRYVRCDSCSMVFLNPAFTDKALELYYRGNLTVQEAAHDAEQEFYTNIYLAGLDLIEKHSARKSLLDIGCSSGFFLDVARNKGWDVEGIELNEAEYETAVKRGHRVWNKTIYDLPPSKRYDVICLWDVFEHIKDGVGFLAYLATRLSLGGVVFLQIPSSDSLAAKIMRDQCNMFDGLEHVNLYGESSIRLAADRAGFEIVEMRSIIDELQPIHNFLNYESPYFGSFRPDPRLDFLSPEAIHGKLLGYKFQLLLKAR